MPGVPVPDGGGRGGGGGGGVDPTLIITPTTPLNLGSISSAAPTNFVVTLRDVGAASGAITISSINFSDPQFTTTDSFPIVVGATTVTLHLRVTPTTPGAKTCVITFNHDGSNSPTKYTVNAVAIDPSTQGIPTIVMVPASLPVGQLPIAKNGSSSTASVGVKNTGGSAFNITIASITVGGPQFALSPVVSLPVTLNPGDTVLFPVLFTPTDIGVFTGNLRFTTSLLAPLNQVDVALSALSVPFFAVSILDNVNRVILLSFDGGELKFPESGDYDYADGDSVLVFNGALWDNPGNEKTLERLQVYFENIGVCQQLTFSLVVQRPSMGADTFDIVNKTISLGTAVADGTDRCAFVDLTATGEIMQLIVTRPKAQGPLALTGIIPFFADRGEKVENV